jgi:hypothetical protein
MMEEVNTPNVSSEDDSESAQYGILDIGGHRIPTYGVIQESDVILSPPDSESSPYESGDKSVGMFFPRVVLRYHPLEKYLPEVVDKKVKCSYAFSEYEFRGKLYHAVEYRFDYAANGAIGCGWCFFPKSECLGYHEPDRERLILLLSEDKKEVEWVCYHRHSEECEWRKWEDTIHSSSGILIVYVARGAHGFYPDEGIWSRIGCCANDLCSSEGMSYEAFPLETHTDPITPSPHNITLWERLCVCFYLKRIRVGP